MDRLRTLHNQEYGRNPEIIVSAPATVNLIGEHTDLNDGLVIESAVDRHLFVGLSKRDDTSLRFFSADLSERKRTSIANLKYRREDRWANYPKGVLYELIQLGYEFPGIDLTVLSDIPPGIGLGLSAAFGVASAVALSELFSIGLTDFQIFQSASMAELSFMGIETSVTDHLVAAVSRESSCVAVDLRELEYQFLPFDLQDVELVVTVSNVPNVAPEGDLAVRRGKCGTCVRELRQNGIASSLRDLRPDELRDVFDGLPEDVRRVCSHVVEENDRVRRGVKMLTSGRIDSFGKLMSRSQDSLRDSYEVSCPEIDWLIKRAVEVNGVLGSRMAGPGFGGATLTLVERDSMDRYLNNIEDYERIFGFKPECFPVSSVAGAGAMPTLVSQ